MPRFLHISDLHYTEDEECNSIVEKFLSDVIAQNEEGKIDFVIMSGDMCRQALSNNYANLNDKIIEPLKTALSLEGHRFFYAPGNHDVEPLYDGKKEEDKKIIEDAITSNNIEEYIKQAVEGNETYSRLLSKFSSFNTFNELLNTNAIIKNNLFKVYKIDFGSYSVGIACFNTCISCFGDSSKHDANKIYFGKYQIEHAISSLKQIQIKIAVFHHPLDWLRLSSSQSYTEIAKLLTENFNLVLNGHIHQSENKIVSELEKTNSSFFYNTSGYLYIKGKKDSSYSIVSFDDPSQNYISGSVVFRRLSEGRTEFDKDTTQYPNGNKHYRICRVIMGNKQEAKAPLQINHLDTPDSILVPQTQNVLHGINNRTHKYSFDFREREMTNATVRNINFSSVDFSKAKMTGTSFINCFFSDINMNGADFTNCIFVDSEFIHFDSFYSISYNNHSHILCVGGTGVIALFMASDPLNMRIKAILQCKKHKFLRVLNLSWHPNTTNIFVSATSDGHVLLWDGDKNLSPIFIIKESNDPVYGLAWSPSGNYIAMALSKTQIKIYKYDADKQQLSLVSQLNTVGAKHLILHRKQILTLSWSLDGHWLISSGIDKIMNIWDLSDPKNPKHLRSFAAAHSDYIRQVSWAKDSKTFYSCGDDGLIKAWKISTDMTSVSVISSYSANPKEDNNDVLSIAVNLEKDLLAVGLRDDQIAIMPLIENMKDYVKPFYIGKEHKGRVWDLCWDANGQYLFSVGNEGKLKVGRLTEDNKLDYSLTNNEFEIKLLCAGMSIHNAQGLDEYGFLVAENKDMPWNIQYGTLGSFLTSRGAIGYDENYI